MNRRNGCRCNPAGLALTAMLVILILLALSSDVSALEMVPRNAGLSSVELDAGYFMGRRGEFRELYGDGLAFGVWYRRHLSGRLGLGLRFGWTQLSEEHGYAYEFKYRDLVIAPTVTYHLWRTQSFGILAAAGAGLSFRKISIVMVDTDYEFDMDQTSPYAIVLAGADLTLIRTMFVAARISYDRHFFGDVETGDFGDSGGFNFGGGIGLTF